MTTAFSNGGSPARSHGAPPSTYPAGPAFPPPAAPASADRLGALWAGRWRILIATLLAALITFAITLVIPQTYSSSAQVGLNASPVTGSSAADLATASNNLAAQFAQVVTSEAVLGPAAAASGTTSVDLSSHTSSGTVASQNIVLITVQAGEPGQATNQANAIANSLIAYVTSQGTKDSENYRKSVSAQLAPLDQQIRLAAKTVATASRALTKANKKTAAQTVSAASARLSSAQSLLTVLTDRRASLAAQATLQSISLAASAQPLGAATPATQVEPRPALYTLIAGLVGLVISSQVVVVAADRRLRRQH